MAGSRFAYVRNFELPDPLLPDTYLVVRLDGHSFHRFSDTHNFVKPNDERALKLMDHAARALMDEFKDVTLAFGQSDEFRCFSQAIGYILNCSNTPNHPLVSSCASHALCITVARGALTHCHPPNPSTQIVDFGQDSKILSTFASYFTSVYAMQWPTYFPEIPCQYPPCFDGRVVAYPAAQHVRDYFAWRQADSECERALEEERTS